MFSLFLRPPAGGPLCLLPAGWDDEAEDRLVAPLALRLGAGQALGALARHQRREARRWRAGEEERTKRLPPALLSHESVRHREGGALARLRTEATIRRAALHCGGGAARAMGAPRPGANPQRARAAQYPV